MKRILVPIDFSKESMNALNAAHSLAVNTDSDVLLLHIVEDPNIETMKISGETHYDPMDNLYVKLLLDKTKERLEAIVNDPKNSDLNMSYKIEIGNAYSSIAENIASHNSSLIVMGSSGATGLQEILVGSVADKTVRYAKCPVIVVKEECSIEKVSDIVFATDLMDDQIQIIDDLKELQSYYGAKIHMIKVFNSEWTTAGEVQERMKAFISKVKLENCTTVAKNSSDLAEAILDYASSIDAGMIAIGTHDRHGLLHLLASHVSKNVLNHAHRPIWTKAIR
ncbi:Nucleotide-binding universal stress protein, UspA family [Reichenbachiella faecimaris]|uniref:Nucleotide-binding universal stress protein, UspA family n=1 Tax=Reichenbachiella faecimaris TaxID=692418 RepID=A0A1W2G6P5_REIFA|nr:universal stress protein [Reichenbachiella faecimaris]SMD32112.1 Nucleotide-binding universal stress protein, UspA family [Reichenbachiella faecimaris]